MNGNCARRFFSIVSSVALLAVSSMRGAEPTPAPADANGNPPYEFEGSIMSEAVRATIGRVFGVGGDAANIEYYSVDLTERKPANATVRSALMPGWGQAFNGEKVKGSVYFLSFAATAVGAVVQYRKSNDTYDHYVAKGLKDDALYDDYGQQRTQAYLLGGAAIFCWALSIFDAHRNAYQTIYSQANGVQVAWNGDRTDVIWRKKF